MGAVFVKTAKGQAELNLRSGALTPRSRRVLILVDGKRSVADLDALIQSETLRTILGQLEEDGFIEYVEAGKPAAAAPQAAAPAAAPSPVKAPAAPATNAPVKADAAPAAHPFGPLPDPTDPKRLRQARQLMSEAIHNFVGTFGTKGLLQQIAGAQTHEELRALYGDWLHLITLSLESPWEISDLRDKLIRVI